jgi:carboxypeptidase C (cathepsin A)
MRVFTLNSEQITGPNDLRFGENPQTLLDKSDLVFVDPVGTGHSVAIAPAVNKDFWGVDSDAMSLSAFVQRYLNVNDRRISPVFLFGESYGGPRTSIMSYHLHASFSVKLSGLVLLAPAMNYFEQYKTGTLRRNPEPINGLPTAAVTAHHFGLLSEELQKKSTQELYDEVAAFTNGPLHEYQKMESPTAEQTQAIEEKFASYSTPTYARYFSYFPISQVVRSPFLSRYYSIAQIIAGYVVPGKALGLYDTRKTSDAAVSQLISDYLVYDPSLNDLDGYNAIHASYLYHGLKYQAASPYWSLGSGAKINEKWNHSTVYPNGSTLPYPDATIHLSAEMLNNTAMKVINLTGYFDAVVQANKVDWDISAMTKVPKELMDKNYSVKRFSGGHMMYADDKARAEIRNTLEGFYQGAVATSVPAMKPQ